MTHTKSIPKSTYTGYIAPLNKQALAEATAGKTYVGGGYYAPSSSGGGGSSGGGSGGGDIPTSTYDTSQFPNPQLTQQQIESNERAKALLGLNQRRQEQQRSAAAQQKQDAEQKLILAPKPRQDKVREVISHGRGLYERRYESGQTEVIAKRSGEKSRVLISKREGKLDAVRNTFTETQPQQFQTSASEQDLLFGGTTQPTEREVFSRMSIGSEERYRPLNFKERVIYNIPQFFDYLAGESGKKYVGVGGSLVPPAQRLSLIPPMDVENLIKTRLLGMQEGEAYIKAYQIKDFIVKYSDPIARVTSGTAQNFFRPDESKVKRRAFVIRVAAEAIPTTPLDVGIYGAGYTLSKSPAIIRFIASAGGTYLGVKGALASDLTPEQRTFSALVGTGGVVGAVYSTPIPRRINLYLDVRKYASELPPEQQVKFYQTLYEAKSLRGIFPEVKKFDVSRLSILENKPKAQQAVVNFFSGNKKLIVGGSLSQQPQLEVGIGKTKRPADMDVYVKSLFNEKGKANKYAVDLAKTLRQNKIQANARVGKIYVNGEKVAEFHPYKSYLRPNIESVTPIYFSAKAGIIKTADISLKPSEYINYLIEKKKLTYKPLTKYDFYQRGVFAKIDVINDEIFLPNKRMQEIIKNRGYNYETVLAHEIIHYKSKPLIILETATIIPKLLGRYSPSELIAYKLQEKYAKIGFRSKGVNILRLDIQAPRKVIGYYLEPVISSEKLSPSQRIKFLEIYQRTGQIPYSFKDIVKVREKDLPAYQTIKKSLLKSLNRQHINLNVKLGDYDPTKTFVVPLIDKRGKIGFTNIYKDTELDRVGGGKGKGNIKETTSYRQYTSSKYPSSPYKSYKINLPKTIYKETKIDRKYSPTKESTKYVPQKPIIPYNPTKTPTPKTPTKTPPYKPILPPRLPPTTPYVPKTPFKLQPPTKEEKRRFGGSDQRRGLKQTGSLTVFLRRFGKFRPIAIAKTPKEAFNIGRSATSKTLGATFKVEGTTKQPAKIFGFRTKKTKQGTLYIEMPKYRLSKRSETKEINLYKNLKGGNKKR